MCHKIKTKNNEIFTINTNCEIKQVSMFKTINVKHDYNSDKNMQFFFHRCIKLWSVTQTNEMISSFTTATTDLLKYYTNINLYIYITFIYQNTLY